MPPVPMSKALRRCAAAAVLAAAACSDSGAAPLGSVQEAPVVPAVAEVVIDDVFPTGSGPQCEFISYHASFQQGGRVVDGFTAVTYLPSPRKTTRVIPPERFREQGIDPGKPLVMRIELAAVGTRTGERPSDACARNLRRRWEFTGAFQELGGGAYGGSFGGFADVGR